MTDLVLFDVLDNILGLHVEVGQSRCWRIVDEVLPKVNTLRVVVGTTTAKEEPQFEDT